jgi:hypothetical protein
MCAVRTETRLHFFGDGTIMWAHSGGTDTYRATTASHTSADIGTIVPCHTALTTGGAITIDKRGDEEYADCDCGTTKVCEAMNFSSFESGGRQFADASRK